MRTRPMWTVVPAAGLASAGCGSAAGPGASSGGEDELAVAGATKG